MAATTTFSEFSIRNIGRTCSGLSSPKSNVTIDLFRCSGAFKRVPRLREVSNPCVGELVLAVTLERTGLEPDLRRMDFERFEEIRELHCRDRHSSTRLWPRSILELCQLIDDVL